MRVIAGKFRSRNLKSLAGTETRPTYDRLRETLFNVLASSGVLEDAIFVDLFAGTGSIGIEALSRGARKSYFVENGRKAAQVIRENLSELGLERSGEVYERDVVAGDLSIGGKPGCRRCLLPRSPVRPEGNLRTGTALAFPLLACDREDDRNSGTRQALRSRRWRGRVAALPDIKAGRLGVEFLQEGSSPEDSDYPITSLSC